MENKIAIEKLTGSNYEAWKFNAEMLLAREQLWKYVEDDPPNPVTVGWKEGDHRTRGTIALLVGAGQRRLIQKCKTTKETWKKLEDTFGKSSPTTVLSMLRRVMTLKFTEGEDIGQHLNEMEDLFERLTNAGYEMPEKIQILIVLWSMPETYDNLGQALVNVADKDLTLELIKVKLTDETLKRQENDRGESVLRVKSGKKQIVCHHCRKPGHLKRDCRLLVEEEESSDEVQYKHNERAEDQAERFAFSADLDKKTARRWLIDSGASAHMCGEKKFFDGMRPIAKRTVTLADGRQTEAEAIGSGMLICKDKDGQDREIVLSGVLYVPELKTNLVSVSRLTQKGAAVSFSGPKCYISQRGRQAAVAINRDGLYYLQQTTRETARLVRGTEIREKQPEVISLDFGFPSKGTTASCLQAGGEFSRVEEEKLFTSNLQTQEEKFTSVGLFDDLQSASDDQDDGGWIKITRKRRAQGKRLVKRCQPDFFRRGGVLE